jgi:alpha-ketoglutarate-dependent taurine dioxygenase
MKRFTVARLSGSFGIELRGGHASSDLGDGELRALLEEHLVVVLREQHLTHAEQVDLARSLGEPTPAHPVVPGHPDHPEILELDAARGGKNAQWHTDVTFVDSPPSASLLVADELPAFGGDTVWASLRDAYETLQPALRSLADGLWAVHRITPLAYWGVPFDTALTRDDAARLYEDSLRVPPVVHPVVRVHPRTERKALMVNPGFTSHIVGYSRIESDHLLGLLYAHSTKPELTIRHRWQSGDAVLWDNRATMHYALDDYGNTSRRMRRVTIRGERATGVDGRISYVSTDPHEYVR